MGSSQHSAGLCLEDHNKLKYSISLNRVGQEVFSQVFKWGYKSNERSFKETLLALAGYNKTRFRKDFSASQRDKIEKGDVSVMDITLLYRLLQLICGLKDPNDNAWVTSTSDSLEYCLYAIKTKRNEVAHEDLMMSPPQLMDKLEKLQHLFIDTICKACAMYNVSESDKNSFTGHIVVQLDAIKNSPVPLPTVAEYEKEKLLNRKTCLIEEGHKEMSNLCNIICQTSVVPCLTELAVNVRDVYTEPRLKRDEKQISERQLSSDESYINVHEMFETKECDGYLPEVTVISSLNGMGKSTLLKYIIDRGINEPSLFKNIENLDLILYQECRKSAFFTLDEFASLLLPRTSSKFQPKDFTQSLLLVDLLLLLDDVDELDQNSFAVLKKFLRLVSPGTRIVLTTSREKSKHIRKHIVSLHKRVMLLELEGITESKSLKHLQKLLNNMPARTQNNLSQQELYELIQTKHPYLQEHLKSPEVLGLIAFSWLYAPDRINATTTVTEIFLLVEDLLVHKLFLGLASSLPSMHEINSINSNLYELLLVLSQIAAETLSKGKFSIDGEDLHKITNECSNLGLPKTIISTFLNYIEDRSANPLVLSPKVSFPRRSTLQYYAAWYVTQKLKEADPSATIKGFLQFSETDDGALSNYQAMAKYLVGMLAALLPAQLKVRAKEIVSILQELQINKTSQWLDYIEEAKAHPVITEEILKVMGIDWEVEDYAISSTFRNVLHSATPCKLTLTVCVNPCDLPHLSQVLQDCKKFPELTLSFHMYKHFWSEKKDYSDEYLKMITGNNPRCNLEHFAGRLSEEAIPCLPTSLKRLALHLSPVMIEPLNSCLKELNELEMLYLNLDLPETVDPSSISSIMLPRKSIIFSVDLWKVGKHRVEWACDVAKALSSAYARLLLRHSSLDSASSQRWLEGLKERNINVSWIVVGSTCDISEEENSQLEDCAKAIGCRQFKWIQI